MRAFPALLLLAAAAAAAQPDLTKQSAWGDKEKKEFLQYLRSDAPAIPSGQAKSLKTESDSGHRLSGARKPKFASLSVVSDSFMTVAGNGSIRREGTGLGPRLLLGGHTFTFLRYYAGAGATRLRMGTRDGGSPLVTHLHFPAGLELALVPLGTPQTRYLLLRGGPALHYFSSSRAASDFHTPVLGWHASWNAGLGYEVQIPDTRWRVNFLLEGYKDMVRRKSTARFYGLGASLGTVFTF